MLRRERATWSFLLNSPTEGQCHAEGRCHQKSRKRGIGKKTLSLCVCVGSCGSGCTPCVFDLYYQEMDDYERDIRVWKEAVRIAEEEKRKREGEGREKGGGEETQGERDG